MSRMKGGGQDSSAALNGAARRSDGPGCKLSECNVVREMHALVGFRNRLRQAVRGTQFCDEESA